VPFNRPHDRERWFAGKTVQMSTCWNGAVAFDANAVRPPANVQFRNLNDTDEQSEVRTAATAQLTD